MSGNAENKVESGHCMEYNQNIQRLSSRSSINLEPSNIAAIDKLGEAQILQLNISENDLIAAKSAFTFQSEKNTVSTPVTSLTSHLMNLNDVPTGLVSGEHVVFGHDMVKLLDMNKSIEIRVPKTNKRTDKNKNSVIQFKKSTNEKTYPNMLKNISLKTFPPNNTFCQEQDTWEVQARQHDASNETAKRIQGSSEVLPRDEYSRAPEVYFCCHFCKQKYPLTKDRIPDINKHMNPSNRYNQVLKIPERLSSSFRENVSWSVMVAKDKSKALVRF